MLKNLKKSDCICQLKPQLGVAPNNAQEPPPPCQAKTLKVTNNQFGTNYTNANVTNTFNYSTGAGPGQSTLNLNINGSTAGVSTGYYQVHWWDIRHRLWINPPCRKRVQKEWRARQPTDLAVWT